MRIYNKNKKGMNLSLKDINGEIMLVSQFTLCAKTKKGRRPDFTNAASPNKAKKLYKDFAEKLKGHGILTKTGIFAADMKIALINDGPVTICLER